MFLAQGFNADGTDISRTKMFDFFFIYCLINIFPYSFKVLGNEISLLIKELFKDYNKNRRTLKFFSVKGIGVVICEATVIFIRETLLVHIEDLMPPCYSTMWRLKWI